MFAGDSGGAIWSENTYCLGGRSADEVDNASSTGCPAKKMSAPHVRSRGCWYASKEDWTLGGGGRGTG